MQAAQNNGTFDFFIPGSNCSDPSGNLDVVDWQDKACTKPGQFSLPAAPSATQLFTAIMRNASRWGGVTYEQDWLDFESDEVVAKHMDVAAGGDWMAALGAGAEAAGLGVQLCMSHTRHVLAAARLRHVTQTRASNDYKEMGSDQWDIGRSSLFADALGLAPAKDSYVPTPPSQTFLLILSPFRFADLFGGAGTGAPTPSSNRRMGRAVAPAAASAAGHRPGAATFTAGSIAP